MTAITNKQWELIEPLLPRRTRKEKKKGGRPRSDDRKTLNGILWVLRTGAQWGEIPKEYGSSSTCWRRMREWEQNGTWEKIWKRFLSQLDKEEKIDWAIAFMDGSFAPSKKGVKK